MSRCKHRPTRGEWISGPHATKCLGVRHDKLWAEVQAGLTRYRTVGVKHHEAVQLLAVDLVTRWGVDPALVESIDAATLLEGVEGVLQGFAGQRGRARAREAPESFEKLYMSDTEKLAPARARSTEPMASSTPVQPQKARAGETLQQEEQGLNARTRARGDGLFRLFQASDLQSLPARRESTKSTGSPRPRARVSHKSQGSTRARTRLSRPKTRESSEHP